MGDTTLVESGGTMNTSANVALASNGATAFGQDQLGGAHTIANINDGLYGNSESWIGATNSSFVGVAFNGPKEINQIAFSRDNTGGFADRDIGSYTLQYTLDGLVIDSNGLLTNSPTWQTIDVIDYVGFLADDSSTSIRHLFEFDPIAGVRGVRIITNADPNSFNLAIDELEANAIPEPASIALWSVLGLVGLIATSLKLRRGQAA
jgi:hypothetical protein